MPSDVEVRVPVLGESVVEATVGAWLKREGEAVEAGEPLVQLETEKVNVDVSADAAGVLGAIQHAEGDTVRPGDVLATLAPAGAQAASPTAEAAPTAEGAPIAAVETVDRPHASPVARRIADERGVDLGQVQGTGTGGRVTREDVERHLTAAGTDGAASPPVQRPSAPAAPCRQPPRKPTRVVKPGCA